MVEAARQAGIDTLPDVQERVRNYRSRLSKSYLLDGSVVDKVLRTAYNRMVAGHDAGRVQVCHIFKYLPQNASPECFMRPSSVWILFTRLYCMALLSKNV